MTRGSRARLAGLAFAIAVSSLSANATVLQGMDVEALARAAQVVAVVRVESVEARWEPDRSMIRTHATLVVERAIAGSPSERIHVSVLGGTVEGSAVDYPAGARFREGDRLAVFLEKRRKAGTNEWLVTGAFQGAFAIERDAETGLEVAVRERVRGGVAITDSVDDEEPLRLYLDELEARVRAVRGAR
jgi:hypothetical protein